jgi:Tfp pilus assembly protein PilO
MSGRRLKFDIRQAGRYIAVVLGLLAAANGAFYFLATRPRVQEYTSLQEGTGPQQEALREQRAVVEEREAYYEALLKAEADLTTLREEILSTRERRMIEVQLELTALAEQFGIDVDSVSFDSQLLREEELDKLVMSVPLEGGYGNLREFLQAVEKSEKFLVVERVALGEGKRGGVMLQLNISLATYFDAPEELKRANEAERRVRRNRARSG